MRIEFIGAAAAALLCTVGCSDSSSPSTPQDQPFTPDPTWVQSSGVVAVPRGPVSSYTVSSVRQRVHPENDGTFEVYVDGPGPTVVWLTDADNVASLAGMIDSNTPGANSISARSTAQLLLYWGLGAHMFSGDLQLAAWAIVRDRIEVDDVATAIQDAFGDDANTMNSPTSPVIAAVDAAAAAMLSDPRLAVLREEQSRRSASLTITPDGPQGGFNLVGNEDAPSVSLANGSLRNGWSYFYKTGHDVGAGPIDIQPPVELANRAVPDPVSPALDPVGLEELIGGVSWQITEQMPIPLVATAEETSVFYTMVTAGGHVPDNTTVPAWWSTIDNPNKQAWLDMSELMPGYTVVKDVLVRLVFSMSAPHGRIYVNDLTPESADAFITAMEPYASDLRAQIDAGEWYQAARDMLLAIISLDTPKTIFETGIEDWTDLTFDFDNVWNAVSDAQVYWAAMSAGVGDRDLSGLLAHNQAGERLEKWTVALESSNIELQASPATLSPSWPSTLISVRLTDVPSDACIRFRSDGPGCLVPADQIDCKGSSSDELLTVDRHITYAVNPLDLVEGQIVTISAEVFSAGCGDIAGADLLAEDTVTVTLRETDPPPPCDPSVFDVAWWQETAGYDFRATGTLGGTITASVRIPGDNRRSVRFYVPWTFNGDDVVVVGDHTGVNLDFSSSNWYLDVRPADAAGQVRINSSRYIEVLGVLGGVTVQCPTFDGPEPECPSFQPDPARPGQQVLQGPLIGVSPDFLPDNLDVLAVP